MGTFHHDKHELHGITVVVDTIGEEIFIGRCDDMDDAGVRLLDVDVHREGEAGRSKADYVERAAQLGFWKKYDRVEIPADRVTSIRRLGDL
jgi:hypothetical protein